MKKKIFSFVQYLFFLLIGLGLLYLVFRKLDPQAVMEEIRNADYKWLALSFVLGGLSHWARAIRWNILIRSMGYETQTSTTFYAVMTGYLANSAFPRLGEVTRCGVLSRKTNVPFNALFGTVISERIFDLIVLVLIIFLVFILQLDFLSDFFNKYVISSVTGMFTAQNLLITVAVLLLVILMPVLAFRYFWAQIKALTFYRRVSDFLRGFFDGIKTIKRMPNKLAFLFWTGVIWLFYILMTYVAFFAINATSFLNFGDGVTIMALGSLGIVAPVPGGIGAYQFIVKAILVEIYGIASEPAASFSLILWATQAILIISLGIFAYYMLLFKKSIKNEKNAAGADAGKNI